VAVSVAVNFGSGVKVEVRVCVGVFVGIQEGVRVTVVVEVMVLDNSMVTSCASNVSAACVASALRSVVGDGFRGVGETMGVTVADAVLVGDDTTIAPSVGTSLKSFVWATVGELACVPPGVGVTVSKSRFADTETSVSVESAAACVGGKY